MKFKFTITLRQLIISFFVFISLLLVCFSFLRKSYPYNEIKSVLSLIKKKVQIIKDGDDFFINKAIDGQLSKQLETSIIGDIKLFKNIETSLLPLKESVFYLNSFPVAGGALSVIKNELVVLDRLGGIYIFKLNILKKLNFSVPNNLGKFILGYKGNRALGSTTLRTHSIAYHKKSRRLFVSYSKFIKANIIRLVVSSIKIDTKTFKSISKWKTIFESDDLSSVAQSTQAGAGKIIIDQNHLFLSVGYSSSAKVVNKKLISVAQDNQSQFGKILKIDLMTGLIEHFSKGHRNAQGMVINSKGKMFNTEHGPQGGDEINIIKQGGNYGFPMVIYGTRYGTYDYYWPEYFFEVDTVLLDPFYSFVPSIGISAIQEVQNFDKRWNGDLLVGSLKGQSLYRIKFKEDRVIYYEAIWMGHRIRDIALLNKEIFVLTDDSLIISLSVNDELLKKNIKGSDLYFNEPKIQKCLQCHHFGVTAPSNMAPSLAKILNRKIGSDNFTKYSRELIMKKGVWTKENLALYIQNPSLFVPGTTMPSLNLSKVEAEEIVEALLLQ